MKGPEDKKEYVSPELSTHGSVEELTGQRATLIGGVRPPRGGTGNRGNGDSGAPFGS